MKGKWPWFSGDSVERLDFWETGLVFLGDNFDWRLAWRGDELYGVEVGRRTGYVIDRAWCEVQMRGSSLKKIRK